MNRGVLWSFVFGAALLLPGYASAAGGTGKVDSVFAERNGRIFFTISGARYCSDISKTGKNYGRFMVRPDDKAVLSLLYWAAAGNRTVNVMAGEVCVNDGDTEVNVLTVTP